MYFFKHIFGLFLCSTFFTAATTHYHAFLVSLFGFRHFWHLDYAGFLSFPFPFSFVMVVNEGSCLQSLIQVSQMSEFEKVTKPI